VSSRRGELPLGSEAPSTGGWTSAASPDPGLPAERSPPEDVRAARESEARYHRFFEESFDGLFITTPSGRFLDVNRKCVAMFGYGSKREMLALDLARDLYADPGARERLLAGVDAAGTGEFDAVVKRKGGEKMLAHFSLTAERDESGATRCYRGVARDVTAQRREEQVREARLRLLEIAARRPYAEFLTATLDELEALTGSGLGFYHLVDADQRTLTFQGWSTSTLRAMKISLAAGSHHSLGDAGVWADCARERRAVVHNDYPSLPHRKGLPEGHAPVSRELVVPVFRGGAIQAIVGMGNKETDYDASDVEVVSRLADLTWDIANRKRAEEESKRLEEQLRQSQKLEAVGRLAGGVAHDFNNILAVINGCADLALDGLAEGDPMREDLVEIRDAGQRAATLTRQLLAFARKQILQPEVLSLNDVVAEAEKMLRRLVGEDVELHTRLASDLGSTVADRSEMEQVIVNLVVNSRDAMPRGGKVTLETSNVELEEPYTRTHPEARPGPYVCLAVSDTGCGMDAETVSRIFEPFFTTKEPGKGTGLGLPTVYGIVRQSGGTVGVYSEPGRGTTVRVYLPRKTAPADAAERHPRSVEELRGHETVLVVEDQQELRGVVERVLRGLGYRVLAAGRAEDALVVSRNEPGEIHLLLTDVVMPGLGGPGLVQALAGARPGMRVLYMSGYSDDAVVKHGILAKEARFLAKPFGASNLAVAVRCALDEPAPAR
jgi:PAS domain S-box-containing protein